METSNRLFEKNRLLEELMSNFSWEKHQDKTYYKFSEQQVSIKMELIDESSEIGLGFVVHASDTCKGIIYAQDLKSIKDMAISCLSD
jgi:hypothetical protein